MYNECDRNYRKFVDPRQCCSWPCTYGKAIAGAPCPHVRERQCRGGGVSAVCNPQPPMLPGLPTPHDHLSLKGMSAQINVWAMQRPHRLRVLHDFSVDGRIEVCLGRAIRVEGDTGFHRAHVGHDPCPKLRHRHIWLCGLLRERRQHD